MEHTIDLKSVSFLNENYKKKISPNKNKGGQTYTVISVDIQKPPSLRNNDETIPVPFEDIYRSVIYNEDETQLLSFSLPKSIPLNSFEDKYKEVSGQSPFFLDSTKFIISEIIEGTMINLWWDPMIEKWEISTKKSISGNYTYFKNPLVKKQKTFKEMFIEVLGDFETPEFGRDTFLNNNDDQSDVSNIPKDLSKNHFYSFVLRHPDNHIVDVIQTPEVYLVAVYEKINDWAVKYIPQTEYQKWNILPNANILYPTLLGRYSTNPANPANPSRVSTYNDILLYIDNENKMRSLDYNNYIRNYMAGVMIIDTQTGDRTKIENSVYQYLKELRGNHPSYKYKYYELVLSNRLNEFIYYFPQYRDLFLNFENEFNMFVRSIHWYYVNKFILKEPTFLVKGNIPYRVNYHINFLHYNIYIPFLKRNLKKSVTLETVYKYIWSMPIKSILYWINYDTIIEKRNKKNEKADPPVPIPIPALPSAEIVV